jgi:hypothetical protein
MAACDGATCVICLSNLSAASPLELDCGHAFHAQCVLRWFRRGNPGCPICRDAPEGDDSSSGSESSLEVLVTAQEASRALRRARSKSAPPGLRRLAKLYQASMERLKCKRRELREHRRNATGHFPVLRRKDATLQRSIDQAIDRRCQLLVSMCMY